MNGYKTHFDAIVVGLGFAGIYALYKLKNEMRLDVKAFDQADGIGGTWYLNRYPGARSDTESLVYRYSFEEETCNCWDWHKRYVDQPQMQAYLQAVVERHQLLDAIQLKTRIQSVHFDEERQHWSVTTTQGEKYTARYFISAVGVLSEPNSPHLPDIDLFKGVVVHPSAWPKDLTLNGRRVGIVGTGSTGVQLICEAAKVAAHLTVFQRSAQFCVPAGSDSLDPERVSHYRSQFNAEWEAIRNSRIACGFEESTISAMSVPEQERLRIFNEHWEHGNAFQFMFGTFGDVAIDPASNKAAADFIRDKIKQIVVCPETARKLCPSDLYAKRPVCTNGYYEAFNRDNVSLVALPETPIIRMTESGIVTADGVEHPLDVLILATGFQTIEGSYNRIDIRGYSGTSLKEKWGESPRSYMGIATPGFPNFFMVLGPQSAFSNLPPSIESQIEFISALIRHAEMNKLGTIEALATAEDAWTESCGTAAAYTLFPKVKSWIFGENVPGKKARVLFYFGGLAAYRQRLREIVSNDFAGFQFGPQIVRTDHPAEVKHDQSLALAYPLRSRADLPRESYSLIKKEIGMSQSKDVLSVNALSNTLLQMITGYWVTQAIYVVAKLGIADYLAVAPHTVEMLASTSNVDPSRLRRVLRTLAGFGVFNESSPNTFALTPLASLLRTGTPDSMRAQAIMHGEEQYRSWAHFLNNITTGKTAFESEFGTSYFDYLSQHPDADRTFNEAQAGYTKRVGVAVVNSYDFSNSKRIVDIGAGYGPFLAAVLERYPASQGVLFDQPHVANAAKEQLVFAGVAERCEIVSGDFFSAVPAGGDVYVLSLLLHDWNDTDCVRILKNCRRAMKEDSKLLIVELVLPEGNEPFFGKWLDLHMLALLGGCERTADEFEKLLSVSGFALSRVIPTTSGMSIVEAHPSLLSDITDAQHEHAELA